MTGGVVFDALGTLLDLGRAAGGAELSRTLHHAASLTLIGEYAPLAEIARAVDQRLPEQIESAEPYDDAAEALEVLADAGIPAYVLTNGAAEALPNGPLARLKDVISVEDVRRFKPDPAPYAHAARVIGVAPNQLFFVTAHGWDVLGAANAGYRAVWVQRGEWSQPVPPPHLRAPSLAAAARLVVARS